MSRSDGGEVVLHSHAEAPWLPAGGRADVIRGTVPRAPMCLVRLLIVSGDRAFCVRRDGMGKLDLPTRPVDASDPSGHRAIDALMTEIIGPAGVARFVGAVRNTVKGATSEYPWPMPVAYFGVWQVEGAPVVDGRWLPLHDGSPLADRHWFPLAREA